jgi:outer membrane protein OmpA-like peptidoglycan-associated protein
MKSSFDQEIQRLMQENVFDNIASGTWGGIKAVGRGLGTAAKTAGQAAYGLTGGREAMQNLTQAASQAKQALMGNQQTQQTQQQSPAQQQAQQTAAPAGRTLKSITNIDNKVKDTLNSSGLTPQDKAVLQAQIPTLVKGLSTNVTDQDLINIVTTVLTRK